MITALDIKWLVLRAAVQNGFVAAKINSDRIERLDHFQTKLLPLLVFGYRDFFDVSTNATVMNTGSSR